MVISLKLEDLWIVCSIIYLFLLCYESFAFLAQGRSSSNLSKAYYFKYGFGYPALSVSHASK